MPIFKEGAAANELTTSGLFHYAGSNYGSQLRQEGVTSMAEPTIAQKSPYGVEVEAGKTYFWCACGKSDNQPFCDGSHQDTEFLPMKFEATEAKKVFFCGCKRTSGKPMCDGTHSSL